jgi:hypothetical protein
MLSLPAHRTDSFSLVFAATGVPTLKLSGNGDAEAVPALDRSLASLHQRLLDAGATSVVVDLYDLYFMNSSCLKAFVAWIYKVRTLGSPYRIRMQLNSRQRWQRRGLEPLQRLAPAVVFLDEIKEEGVEPSDAGGK